jgi:UDP-N-acetylglucosamine--N-acetylmuramyl-(pentapeptide) pyrophosphoryl-undecaprenol N-acetylglucosamine transferase
MCPLHNPSESIAFLKADINLKGYDVEESICFTGGGTGGHVFPGIAVIDELRKLGSANIVWIGSGKGMEKEIIAGYGIPFYGVPSGKLRRYVSLDNFFDVWKIIAGFFASLFLLMKLRPSLVFSKGGYVSVPVVAAAGFLGIPVFTHESDSDPGIATRIDSLFAEKILTSFEETKDWFPEKTRPRVELTGNPIRTVLLGGNAGKGRAYVGCQEGKKILLVLGGSQGARPLNIAVREMLDPLCERCFVVHQTGKNDFMSIAKQGYFSQAFFKEELSDILACASLVVCRAGSNTLWELAALGIPAILVPLASGSRGDQVRNAAVFEREGAALVVTEDANLASGLLEIICKLIDNDAVLERMALKARSLSRKDAAERIADLILRRLGESRRQM